MPNPKPNTTGLIPWEKGQSGNSSGRPKGRVSLTKILVEMLKDREMNGTPNPGGMMSAECLVAAMIMHAAKNGSPALFQLIFDRNDGKVPEIVETGTPQVVRKAAEKALARKRTRRTD